MRCTLLALLSTSALQASVLLDLHFSVIEKALGQAVFTQEGRKYVRGSQTTRCSFAYLTSPKISGNGGRLFIRARFTGRSALDVLGRCVGLGDDFPLTIQTSLAYDKGLLRFRNVVVDTLGRDSFYISRVRTALIQALEKDFSLPLEDSIRRTVEQPQPDSFFTQKMSELAIPRVEVTDSGIVLYLDFRLSVK